MKKSRFLIVFMILAMGSLVALQWYWIQNAIDVKKEQFDKSVKTALVETVRKIEQEEVLYVAQQRLNNKEQNKLLTISDETKGINDAIIRKKILEHDIVLNSIYNEGFFRDFSKKLENLGERIPENSLKATEYINEKLRQENENLKSFIKSNDTLDSTYHQIQIVNKWIDSTGFNAESLSSANVFGSGVNLDLVKGIIHDLMLGERSISERMGHVMLDTLLKNELKNMGITQPFRYGVEDKGKLVLASSISPAAHDNYKIRLFPADSFQSSQFLYVSFPEKDNYIYKNLTGLFTISAVLIFLVGGIFYYSANSLISERRLAKVKNDFINNMTHELKTPVSSISLALEVIQDKDIVKTEEKKNRYLGIIKEENQRLASHINKVLEIARLEQGQVEMGKETVDINQVLRSVIQNMEVQLSKENINFSFDNKASDTWVNGDKVHLTNIFYNLLDNAIKYSKEFLTLKVSVTNPVDGAVRVDISDNGIGMLPAELDRIFEKFYRIDTGDVHNVKGFGIGLSYVKNIIEMHNGTVQVVSKPGEGSTFSIQLKTIS